MPFLFCFAPQTGYSEQPKDEFWPCLMRRQHHKIWLLWYVTLMVTSEQRKTATAVVVVLAVGRATPMGFALSPIPFVVVMDGITRDFQKAAPCMLLNTDDVMLACEDKGELERQADAWCDRLALFGLKLNVKNTEHLTDVNEHGSIKINGIELSQTTGVTRLNRVRNDTMRQAFGVAPIAEKREARLRWYGHVLRANDDTV
ncbi:unnamed protein product [Heligmosomoides polygyrus]|uniref:Reverse transcriptase domain-containing protein n=1 Tax=Heligmosomoides polygyrus TaxID=6339 RepID=A0A183GEI2_HELPZ|nr:unnamed protein product [Heligmosomoides polygyrus]